MHEREKDLSTHTRRTPDINRESMDKDMSTLQEALSSLFKMSRDPVLGVGAGDKIVFANPAAASLLGAQPGMPAGDIIPRHILTDPADSFIATQRLRDRRANVSVVRMDGVAVFTYSVLEPPPALQSPQAALQELSSRLMSARLAIDALVRRTKAEEDPDLRDTSETLYREYFRMLRLCRHMTLAAGIYRDDLPLVANVTDLGNLCRELCQTVSHFSESLGISIHFQADFGMHLTMADRDMIEIMLLNLLSNSLSHSKAGDVIHVELTRQEDRFVFAVRDAGTGMTADKMANIFHGSPAVDTADPTVGAGLGLVVARGVAERHGGFMILESRPGEGSSVRVSIPCRKSESLQAKCPITRYRSDGMNNVLMELSGWLDKKYFNHRLFD